MASTSKNSILVSALIVLSLFVTETLAVNRLGARPKNLFDIGCATLCQDYVGVDPIDVNGDEFADLITEYLEQEGGGGNSTDMGNSTDTGNSTDIITIDVDVVVDDEDDEDLDLVLDVDVDVDGMGGNSTTPDNDIKLLYGSISCWDTRDVTDMSAAFAFQDEFSDEVGCWNVEGVTDMSDMFLGATSFNEDLNIWGDKVPREGIITTDMFKDSGCEVTSPDPDTIGRPWCQYKQPEFSFEFNCFFFNIC